MKIAKTIDKHRTTYNRSLIHAFSISSLSTTNIGIPKALSWQNVMILDQKEVFS